MATDILAVVSNYARPGNVEPICRRLVEEGCDVVVADNATAQQSEHYAAWSQAGVRDIWSWRVNSGPPARWWPALAVAHEYRYLMFVDDDFLPRRGLVAALLNQAAVCRDRFAAIGRIGRYFTDRDGTWRYVRANMRARMPIHMTGGGEFVVADRLLAAVEFRNELARAGATAKMLWHDDLILDLGIQRKYRFPAYMTDGGWAEAELPGGGYCFSRKTPEYRADRDGLINLCHRCGWEPVLWIDWSEAANGT